MAVKRTIKIEREVVRGETGRPSSRFRAACSCKWTSTWTARKTAAEIQLGNHRSTTGHGKPDGWL